MFQLPDACLGSPFLRAQRYVIVIVIIVFIVLHNSGYGWPYLLCNVIVIIITGNLDY